MKTSTPLRYTYIDSPLGQLLLVGEQETVHYVGLPEGKMVIGPLAHWRQDDSILAQCKQQLAEYFQGVRQRFDLHLLTSGTQFQQLVWQQLQHIPYGKTHSYKDIAHAVARPKAVRAVGAANGKNPIPIIIPCHRVVGADGSLTGFGGGMDAKRYLLTLEGAL